MTRSAQKHAQHGLGAPRVRLLRGDQVEVGVGLDQAHDHIGDLVQVHRERQPAGVRFLVEDVLDRGDQARLEVGVVAREQAHGELALVREPAPHAGVRDHVVEEARDDADDALGARRAHALVGLLERPAAERPDHLDEQLLARADPAVERHAVHAELVGERAHVDPLGRQELVPRKPEGVERGGTAAVGRTGEVALELGTGSGLGRHARSFADSYARCRRATFRVFVAYPHRTTIQTRWKDNDVYGHVNNVEYYSFFDTAINAWLISEGGLDIHDGEVIGVCAESHCQYKGAIAFPDTIDVGLRVGKLGRSSVTYELELGRAGEPGALAEGWFVHVFVDRGTRRPVEIPAGLRDCLERLQVAAGEGAAA